MRVDEEVVAVIDVLGTDVPITGFYSYGEISPLKEGTQLSTAQPNDDYHCFLK
ncbi:MAG: hypothetical protein IPQ18_14830 [Saprospiraceae bacterium]|nr:hypothetical protein [Saprospiraceae bacterium]